MPLPSALSGTRWTERTARRMLPLLVWCAQREKKITYGQLDLELQRRNWGHHVNVVVYGHPAGAIGDALAETEAETGNKIPPLNALLVNARTGVPGSGCDYYLKSYLDRSVARLTEEQRKAMAEEIMDEIWRFRHWDDILADYGLAPIKGGIPSLREIAAPKAPGKGGWSKEAESEAHRKLKLWVAAHPEILKSRVRYPEGLVEWLFASADRVDVMFTHNEGCVAVEVKAINSNDADLERGIYQCVKYQALLRAELKASQKIPNGSSLLVTERKLPPALQQLADLLGVRSVTVPTADDR